MDLLTSLRVVRRMTSLIGRFSSFVEKGTSVLCFDFNLANTDQLQLYFIAEYTSLLITKSLSPTVMYCTWATGNLLYGCGLPFRPFKRSRLTHCEKCERLETSEARSTMEGERRLSSFHLPVALCALIYKMRDDWVQGKYWWTFSIDLVPKNREERGNEVDHITAKWAFNVFYPNMQQRLIKDSADCALAMWKTTKVDALFHFLYTELVTSF